MVNRNGTSSQNDCVEGISDISSYFGRHSNLVLYKKDVETILENTLEGNDIDDNDLIELLISGVVDIYAENVDGYTSL
ncbi:MAG: hypothetical protein LUI05_07385 [Oscillospiraceae bacterium]|nr:hypothetical protein [Oscillospiraceae bacterium]